MDIKEKIWCYADLLKHIKIVKGALYGEKALLNKSGWRDSLYNRTVGGGVPWCTYAYTYFIEPRLQKDFLVFEYGSGSSTSFYAKRCAHVVSLENNRNWYEREKKELAQYANVELQYVPDGKDFFEYIRNREERFDLVIVDSANGQEWEGKGRVYCAESALPMLSDRGVMVVDDMEQIPSDFAFMKEQGFKRIDFYGLAPSVDYEGRTTTCFYREGNCLGI